MQPALALLATLLLACNREPPPREVDIHATNYAFRAPATLPPGATLFRLVNDGSVLHEVQLFRFRAGVPADSARAYLAADRIPDEALDASGSVLIAGAGQTARERVLIPLGAGELYGLLCEFKDADSLPRHAAMGMFALLQVK